MKDASVHDSRALSGLAGADNAPLAVFYVGSAYAPRFDGCALFFDTAFSASFFFTVTYYAA